MGTISPSPKPSIAQWRASWDACCAEQRRAAVDQLDRKKSELLVGARAIIGLDEIAGHQDRPQAPRLAAADVARLDPVRWRQRADDRAMLAMGADGDDDGFGGEMHRARR